MVKYRTACALSALALVGATSIVPVNVFADTNQYQVDTFEELLAAFGATWDSDEGEMVVTLTGDIEQAYGEGDYLKVNEGWTTTLDLNGYTLTLRNDGPRGLINYGSLIITGNGTITDTTDESQNEAYGLVDNYGGTVVVENGTFIDYGQGGGAVFKNRAPGKMTINGATITAYGEAGGNACIYSDSELTVADGVKMTNYGTDEMHDGYFGAYALIIGGGTATLGTTVGNIDNPVEVTGNRGGLALNNGAVTVNNGIYRGGKYYGIWITNDGDASQVYINYADAHGKIYGVYSTVDDGKQDLSDVGITIADGKYSGGTKAAVAINGSHSEHSFGMSITGGEYSTSPDASYLAENHVVYDIEDETYPYAVAKETTYGVSAEHATIRYGNPTIVKVVITPEKVGEHDNPFSDYTVTSDNEAISYDKTTGEVSTTSIAATSGNLTFTFHDESTKVVEVTVEKLSGDVEEEDDMPEEEDAKTIQGDAQAVIDAILDGETGEIGGFEYAEGITAEDILDAVADSETVITTAVVANGLEDVTEEEKAAIEEEVANQLPEGAVVAGYLDIKVKLVARNGEDKYTLGYLSELSEPVTLTAALPEGLPAVAEGVNRTYYVACYHDGEVTLIPATDNGDGTVSFLNGNFSTFAIVYEDTEEAPEEDTPEAPETGTISRQGASAILSSIVVAMFVGIMTTVISFAYIMNKIRK